MQLFLRERSFLSFFADFSSFSCKYLRVSVKVPL